ncbi:IclR family transcriptional regulator [Pseudarthrobacter sp. R1]|uniref:IclR family transcriptional regulator n=1 Tax=Pseudarthrobacter sp. R1 TaxID=2944934 RepID=UPI0021091E17|nr:IclR family transcriptional regulator [Pseudarthrobacter sp. R1]MCQ6272300.1 IclR family transcriptional regulator [Pseudarthrobacter sp. R1]
MTNQDPMGDEPRSQTRIQSVSRAVGLLLAVAESTDGETAKRLAEKSGLSLATTYHLLTTLWGEGMLTKDDLRVFRLGTRVGALVDAYQRLDSVPAAYRQALQSVARRTGESVFLGVWRNSGVQVLDRAEGTHAVRVVGLDVGFAEDMHARASAKLFLAFAPKDLRDGVLERMRLRPLTPQTITRKSNLLSEFTKIRESGLAYDREEFRAGVTCVSVPIWRGDNIAACLTVSSPTQRFEDNEGEIVSALKEAAESVREA